MTRAILRILASPRFLLGLALLGAVVLLSLAACGPGADRTPKKAEKGTVVDRDPWESTAGEFGVASPDGTHGWKICTVPPAKIGDPECDEYRVPGTRRRRSYFMSQSSVETRLDDHEARLKKLENPPPTYRADPAWNTYVEPILDVPHFVPCDDPQVGDVLVYDAKTGKPLCRADAPKLAIDQAFGDVDLKAGTTTFIPAPSPLPPCKERKLDELLTEASCYYYERIDEENGRWCECQPKSAPKGGKP